MCDKVAIVENRTVAAFGTHMEVLKNNAYYKEAWKNYNAARAVTYSLRGAEGNENK